MKLLFIVTMSLCLVPSAFSFTSTATVRPRLINPSEKPQKSRVMLSATSQQDDFRKLAQTLSRVALASTIFFLSSLSVGPARADELGVETEAPTLFTGESVMICTKRGPLGACLKTEARTADNDNDKADKYFQDPSPIVKEKEAQMRASIEKEDYSSELIRRLKQQSQDNKDKNDLLVKQKTAQNDQSASFGPFDRQVVIMNANGEGFTLLNNPQAMRLKDAGFIKDRKFVKQPTEQEMDDALEAPEGSGIGGFIKGFLGDDSEKE